jgi:hypothetical protein
MVVVPEEISFAEEQLSKDKTGARLVNRRCPG